MEETLSHTPYYHVRLSIVGRDHDEVKSDLDAETLERQFLSAYRAGQSITVNGRTVTLEQLERIRISRSVEPIERLIERVKVADRNSSVVMLGGPSYESRAAAEAEDVTDQFITAPPGFETVRASRPISGAGARARDDSELGQSAAGDPRAVFVVAGRDLAAAAAVVALLRALRLDVVEWEHAVAKTGLPSPYVGDVVLAGLSMAGGVVVVLTPDDLVRLRDDLVRERDGGTERETQRQARPNVYYEAGIADALSRDRTVIVEIGEVKSFSDVSGRHVVRYDGSPSMRHTLAERLRVAGLTVDTTGQDWLSAGDLAQVAEAVAESVALERDSPAPNKVDKAKILSRIDSLLDALADMHRRSVHDDLSDLGEESLDFVVRSQTLVDQFGSGSAYVAEAAKVAVEPPHVRIPVLAAVLRAIRADVQPDSSP